MANLGAIANGRNQFVAMTAPALVNYRAQTTGPKLPGFNYRPQIIQDGGQEQFTNEPTKRWRQNAYEPRRVPWWSGDTRILTVSANGTYVGLVYEGDNPVPGCIVRLYWRANGQYLDTQATNAAGQFTFSNLDPTDSAGYFAVAFDPAGGVQYNAVIYDLLTAV